MRQVTSLAIYLGMGAMLHALFLGAHFDWSSAWTWGWLFGWPIMLVLSFWALCLGIAGLCFVGLLAYAAISSIVNLEGRRRRAAFLAMRKVRRI